MIFNHLDKGKTGFLTYNEFCGILTDKYRKQKSAEGADKVPEDIEK